MGHRQDRPRVLRKLRVWERRIGRWVDQHAGEWDESIPSWGLSLLFHGAIILLLALYLYARGKPTEPTFEARFATQLTEDMNSLVDADRAGDPFTTNDTDEPPSLTLEPAGPEVTAINQPNLPVIKFRPEIAAPQTSTPAPTAESMARIDAKLGVRPPSVSDAKALGTMIAPMHFEDMTAPFSGRDEATRAKLVRREGGTIHSEKAVEDGLHWLIRHQRADGSWSLNFQDSCHEGGCPPQEAMETQTGATGLALLPLLGAGHIHNKKTRYQINVRQGLDWLVANQQINGDLWIVGGGTTRMYSHAIATMALCEAYGISKDPKLREPAQKAIDFIIDAQNTQTGGWRYQPGQEGDTSVFGWQMFALRSARLAGLQVPPNVIKGCTAYLDAAASDKRRITYGYQIGFPATPVMTAEALLSRQYLGWPRTFPPLVKGASMVAANLNESPGRNIYYWYYATQLLHNMQNKDWQKWNVRVRDGLVEMQVKGVGCDRGSWDPFLPQPDRWARSGGRLYLTALSVLTLEVYYRYLPLYQPSDNDKLKLNNEPPTEKKAEDS